MCTCAHAGGPAADAAERHDAAGAVAWRPHHPEGHAPPADGHARRPARGSGAAVFNNKNNAEWRAWVLEGVPFRYPLRCWLWGSRQRRPGPNDNDVTQCNNTGGSEVCLVFAPRALKSASCMLLVQEGIQRLLLRGLDVRRPPCAHAHYRRRRPPVRNCARALPPPPRPAPHCALLAPPLTPSELPRSCHAATATRPLCTTVGHCDITHTRAK